MATNGGTLNKCKLTKMVLAMVVGPVSLVANDVTGKIPLEPCDSQDYISCIVIWTQ